MSNNWEELSRATRKAWTLIKTAESKLWAHWMVVGEGLYEGRRWAMQQAKTDKPEGKGYTLAYGEWLKRCKVEDMDASDRAKLLQIMEERPAIEEWRAGLPTNVRRSLNNPTTVWRRWKKDTKVGDPRPRGKDGAKLRAKIEQQQARIEELEQELESRLDLTADSTPEYVATVILELFPDTAEQIAKLILDAPQIKRKRNSKPIQEGVRP